MVGFNNVQAVAHKMEDILACKRKWNYSELKVVDVLYKTVDLSEIIQKSIAKGKEIYVEDISKYITNLENVQNETETIKTSNDQIDFGF